ncbi:MAG: PAS domain S-box protein [Micrococcales bacterium]|nr:PAS domain S-box protein [Micrococcales bacterium]
MALLQELLDGKRDSYRLLRRFTRPKGQEVWGDMAVAGVRDETGRVLFLINTIVDLTELVRSRDDLAESREAVSHACRAHLRRGAAGVPGRSAGVGFALRG